MAEVRINITAEDKASQAFSALSAAVEGMRSGVGALAAGFRDVESRTIAASAGALEYSGRVSAARSEVSALGVELRAMNLTRTLALDVSDALWGAREVKGAIDAIPDITYKTVIVEYQTKASPVRPFTEGIEQIRRKMESLPQETTHTVRYVGGAQSEVSGMPSVSGQARPVQSSQAAQTAQVSFAPSVTVVAGGGDGASIASELDSALAELWLRHRSELRRAIEQCQR